MPHGIKIFNLFNFFQEFNPYFQALEAERLSKQSKNSLCTFRGTVGIEDSPASPDPTPSTSKDIPIGWKEKVFRKNNNHVLNHMTWTTQQWLKKEDFGSDGCLMFPLGLKPPSPPKESFKPGTSPNPESCAATDVRNLVDFFMENATEADVGVPEVGNDIEIY